MEVPETTPRPISALGRGKHISLAPELQYNTLSTRKAPKVSLLAPFFSPDGNPSAGMTGENAIRDHP
jgi:hypothetical protein